jgi:hypothetical protein
VITSGVSTNETSPDSMNAGSLAVWWWEFVADGTGGEGIRTWHDIFVEQIPLAEKVVRVYRHILAVQNRTKRCDRQRYVAARRDGRCRDTLAVSAGLDRLTADATEPLDSSTSMKDMP